MTRGTDQQKLPYNAPVFERYGSVSDLTRSLNTNQHIDGIGGRPTSACNKTH